MVNHPNRSKSRKEAVAKLQRARDDLAKAKALIKMPPPKASMRVLKYDEPYAGHGQREIRSAPTWLLVHAANFTDAEKAEIQQIIDEMTSLTKASEIEVNALNDAAYETQLPDILKRWKAKEKKRDADLARRVAASRRAHTRSES